MGMPTRHQISEADYYDINVPPTKRTITTA